VLGTQDLLIGLVLAAFFFGAKRLPELARSLGQSMTEFKKGVAGDDGGRHEPEPAAPAAGAAAAPVASPAATAPRACPACRAALEAEWTHCPRCGAAAPRSEPPDSAP
jgi:sec-independent protein translocase protein TatA